MLIVQRQSRLQEIIAQRGMIDLESLARELAVSDSTVRRDISELEKKGLVSRTHGGVIWKGDNASKDNGSRPYAFEQRLQYKLDAKQRIANAAAKLVRTGETVLLDGGTTTFFLAQQLLGRQMQIVTNSLPIASLFANDDHVEMILTGGVVYPRYGVLLGPAAETTLSTIHATTLFMSVAGLHRGATYNQNMLLVQAERKMMEQSQRTVLLVDSSKFGQQALVKLCELSKVDVLVTDARPPKPIEDDLLSGGVELIIAP
jgi:DeoR family transcriptional regulator, fructose operon transcriptional repressor